MLFISKLISNRNASLEIMSTVKIDLLSRGIALRKLPPFISEIRKPKFVKLSNNSRFIILLAFPSPLSISIPEWPPFNPLTVIKKAIELSGTFSSE